MKTFPERLHEIQQTKRTTLALTLSPKIAMLPLPIQKFDDPFLPFGKAIISATHDLVCAYLFDLAAYLALGAAGAVALERTIAYARASGDVLTILHGLFATVNYVDAAGAGGFNVDAVTVIRCGNQIDVLQAYSDALNGGVIFTEKGYSGVHPPPIPVTAMFDNELRKINLFSRLIPGFESRIHVAGDEVLYAGQREDYEVRVRSALEVMREGLRDK